MQAIRRRYRILDVDVTLESDSEELLRAFDQDYGLFAVHAREGPDAVTIRFRRGIRDNGRLQESVLQLDGRTMTMSRCPKPDLYAYILAIRHIISQVKEYIVLHGAVLARGESALVISGPSGAGKTTLTLALLGTGLSYLSDDYCPIHTATGRVHPFPRSLWVSKASAHMPRELARTLSLLTPPGRKASIPPELLEASLASRPCVMKSLVLLDPGDVSSGVERVHLGLMEEGEGLFLDLTRGLSGVELERLAGDPCGWQISYPGRHGYSRKIVDMLHAIRPFLWYAHMADYARPDFSPDPRIERITIAEAAHRLLRQLKQDPLADGGAAVALKPGARLVQLMEILEGVSCYRLTPGRLDILREMVLSTLE